MARARKGIKSSAQDNFLAPMAVTDLTASNVGTNRGFNDGAANLSWNLPANSPAASSYDITTTPTTTTTNVSGTSATVTGLSSDTNYTFTVVAKNSLGESTGTTSSSVLITTVPATPTAPSASTVNGSAQDTISWTAPANGGSAISLYYWESNDGKAGTTSSTSVTLGQEAGTSQSYRVRAENGNGLSSWSAYSSSVTTFSFTPFSFVPYSFVPSFSFVPFSFVPYSFVPSFTFAPVSFCIDQDTLVQVVGLNDSVELKPAKDIKLGDSTWAISWDGLLDESADPHADAIYSEELLNVKKVKSEIVGISPSTKSTTLYLNGDSAKRFTPEEKILVKRNNQHMFIEAKSITTLDEIFEATESGMTAVPVTSIDYIDEVREVFMFNASPVDTIIAGNIIVHNRKDF